ncbi:NAD(P)/FAD-dependent oxidoreductase [Pseudooceanicola sp.]|uniref:NAD(P)/FAD-dependent oxidoreductase n=1 Tax=Pseudooceanicola sp. TaxID=1914328 RepID=UPI0040591221
MTGIDVTIRGAGIFGLSCAWACMQRGAKVQIIDPGGVAAGASGGVVGALAPHVPENWNEKKAFQLDSLLMAADWWQGIETKSRLSTGYARTGRLQPLADHHACDLARAREITARALWGEAATWWVTEAPGAFAPISPTGLFIHDTLSARVHPRKASFALAEALRLCGCDVITDGSEQGVVIHATGVSGLEEMGRNAGRMIGTGVKGQAALLQFSATEAPQVFASGIHVVPHGDGTVAIGSTSERDYTRGDITDEALTGVISQARDAVPALRGAEVVATWAGVRPRARSRAPMLGAWPGRAGHYIANGGFKIGFGVAPKVGQVMADLVLEGRDSIPPDFRAEKLWP